MENLNLWVSNCPPPPPLPPASSLELGTTATHAAAETRANHHHVDAENEMMRLQWSLVVIGVCFAAISATLQALQTTTHLPHRSQMVVFMALVTSFTSFLVSVYIRSIYKRASVVAVHVGILFASIALMVSIVGVLPTPFMVMSSAVYLLGIFVIVFAHLFKPSTLN